MNDPTARTDRDALTEARRAQFLAREKAVEYDAAADTVVVLEHQAHLFEDALLARNIEIDEDVRFGQELCYEIHRRALGLAHA